LHIAHWVGTRRAHVLMARLSANGWQHTRRARGAQQWQSQGGGFAQAGFNYEGGGSRGDSGSRYDSSSTREPDASPRRSETSSRQHSARFDDRHKYERGPHQEGGSTCNSSARHDANTKFEAISVSLVDAFDKKITSVQKELSTSLQEATSKDNEKFDLIFSVLIELQRRQAQLEESMRSLKTQLQQTIPPVAMQMGGPVQQQGPIQNGSNSASCRSPASPQGASSMGQQPVCVPAGQMPMGQQCGSMIGPNGSMQMVFVVNSSTGNQMSPYGASQVMCSSAVPVDALVEGK